MCDLHLSEEEREYRPTGPVAFVDEIVVALTNGRIYSAEHPRMKSSLQTLQQGLRAMLETAQGDHVRIGAAEGFLFFDQRPLLGVSLSSRRLLDPLSRLESGGVSFAPETTLEDLRTFIHFLGREVNKVEHQGEANLALDQQGCRSIRFLEPFCPTSGAWTDVIEARLAKGSEEDGHQGRGALGSGGAGSIGSGSGTGGGTGDGIGFGSGSGTGSGTGSGDGTGGAGGRAGSVPKINLDFNIPVRLYQEVVLVMQDAMLNACQGRGIDTASSSTIVESILKQLGQNAGSMLGQARYEKYDAFTFGHSIRVCFIALNFARHLTKDERLLHQIGLASLMHDIGKAKIPFDILHSTGRLSDEERLEMNMHTVHGGLILLESGAPDPLAVAVAFSHHQNIGGTGYPTAIRGRAQSPATMIVKIADVYEALTAARPYKAPMSPARAYRIMIDMTGNFEPSLLRKFIQVNGVYPVGSHVHLSSGEVARVDRQTPSLLEPWVTPLLDASGSLLSARSAGPLDLREAVGDSKITVVGSAAGGDPIKDAA